jgi:hypothetical protein
MLKALEYSTRSLIYVTSDSTNNIANIEAALRDNGFQVLKVIGLTSSGVMKVMDKLRNTEGKACLIVSSIQHSAGFNLQFVDTIVMYQRMHDREAQIIGRGMRPGRTEPLKVYRILYENE